MNSVSICLDSYPNQIKINDKVFVLVSETDWIRRFRAKDGDFHVRSRIRDGSFNFDLLRTLDIENLSDAQKSEAALALTISGRKDIPIKWSNLVEKWKERNELCGGNDKEVTC